MTIHNRHRGNLQPDSKTPARENTADEDSVAPATDPMLELLVTEADRMHELGEALARSFLGACDRPEDGSEDGSPDPPTSNGQVRVQADSNPPVAAFHVHLRGPLGAGKTTLVRGVLRGLGHQGPVKSPTFSIVEPYELKGLNVFHFDLYRLANSEELEFIGARDYFIANSLCLFEWPERAEQWLPAPALQITIEYGFDAVNGVSDGSQESTDIAAQHLAPVARRVQISSRDGVARRLLAALSRWATG